MLQGDFEASYTRADNRLVVPTDTMKNTVYVLAQTRLGTENELFGVALAEHFLQSYPQVSRVEIGLAERGWDRLSFRGRPHPHAFIQNTPARLTAKVVGSRSETSIESGIEDLLLLKTTGSGFSGFHRDRYTTLAETEDRILATKLKATWLHEKRPSSYARTNEKLLRAMLAVFANSFSPSVQVTLYQMGEAALKAAPGISGITLTLPNKHCLLVNLAPFALENRNEIFVPTDEPHGQIEGTVSRK